MKKLTARYVEFKRFAVHDTRCVRCGECVKHCLYDTRELYGREIAAFLC